MKKFSNGEISAFCEELAMFVDSGVAEEEAINRMAEDEGNKIAEAILKNYDFSISKAMQEADAFPAFLIDMVDVGESTGRLGRVLLNLSEYYERQEDNQNRISSLIIYPSALMFILSVILLFIALKVFPIFNNVYEDLGGAISGDTQWIITFATVISWALFIICLVVGIMSLVFYNRWKKNSDKVGALGFLKNFSYVRKISYQIDLAKFTSAVNNYYSAGIDLESSITYAGKLVGNEDLIKKINNCILDCQAGEDISKTFRDEEIYGTVNNRTLYSAISSGKLNDGLDKMRIHQWEIVDQKLRDVTDSIEPLVTLGLSVVIGLLLISVMTPLIEIMTSIA